MAGGSKVKVGDVVRVKSSHEEYGEPSIWHEFMGATGVIVAKAKRLHIPAFKVMLIEEVVEFDHDELELVKS